MPILPYLDPGLKMLTYAIKRHILGHKKYKGNFTEIGNQILKDCYVKSKKYPKHKYYNVSNGHFKQFYCRDFGMITEALLKLGYKKEVFNTLKYALFIFKKHNKITTTISKDCPVDFFDPAPDSLPFLIRSIRLALEHKLPKEIVKQYTKFLSEQIKKYYNTFYDKKKIKIKTNIKMSSSKDHYIRKSCSYDNSAAIGLAIELKKINTILNNTFQIPIDIKKAINKFKETHWSKTFFYDDLTKGNYIASDANIMPFYWEVFKDKQMKESALNAIINTKLDKFLPVQYTNFRDKGKELLLPELFAPNYEGDTYWPHVGICYMEVLKDTYPEQFKANLSKIKQQVLKHKNFIELYTKKGKPYRSIFYVADDSMSWVAPYMAFTKP